MTTWAKYLEKPITKLASDFWVCYDEIFKHCFHYGTHQLLDVEELPATAILANKPDLKALNRLLLKGMFGFKIMILVYSIY